MRIVGYRLWLAGTPANDLVFAGLGTLLAGYGCGLAYAALGNLYVSFMSGNTAHLGQQLAQLNFPSVALTLSVLAGFVWGTTVATLLLDHLPRRLSLSAILAIEIKLSLVALALSAAGAGWLAGFALVLVMGLHAALHRPVDGVDLGRGYVTGHLFAAGEALARLSQPGHAVRVGLNLFGWLLLALGVCLGSAVVARFGEATGLIAVPVVLCVLAAMLWRYTKAGLHPPSA